MTDLRFSGTLITSWPPFGEERRLRCERASPVALVLSISGSSRDPISDRITVAISAEGLLMTRRAAIFSNIVLT
jgi:hypothetical protein